VSRGDTELVEEEETSTAMPVFLPLLALESTNVPRRAPRQRSHRPKEPEATPERQSEILRVFDHYRNIHPRSFTTPHPKSAEWRAIAARLSEGFSVDDLCAAIDGMHLTPHNLGENDRGTKYLGLGLAMRSGDQVTRFSETARSPPPPVLSTREQKSHRALTSFLARHSKTLPETR